MNNISLDGYPYLKISSEYKKFNKNVIKKNDVLQIKYDGVFYTVMVSDVTDDTIYLYNPYGDERRNYHTISIDSIGNCTEIITNLVTKPETFNCVETDYRIVVNEKWFTPDQLYLVHITYPEAKGKWVTRIGSFDFAYSNKEIMCFKNKSTMESFEIDLDTIHSIQINPVEYFQMPEDIPKQSLSDILNITIQAER